MKAYSYKSTVSAVLIMIGIFLSFAAMSNEAHAADVDCWPESGLLSGFTCVDVIRGAGDVRDFGADPVLVILVILRNILTVIAIIAVGVVSAGGIMYIMSLGDEEKARRAKLVIVFAVIGLLIILLAVVIVNAIINIFFGPVPIVGGFQAILQAP